jgi:hypothetical protein
MLAKWPPLKLAQLAFAASLLSLSRILTPPLILIPMALRGQVTGLHPSHLTRVTYNFVSLVLVWVPSLIGAALLILARRRIKQGLEKKQWTVDETNSTLAWLQRPVVNRTYGVAFWIMACCFVSCLFARPLGSRTNAFQLTADLFILSSAVLPSPKGDLDRIRKRLSPEPPPRDPINWKTYKPLHSEHWGRHDLSSAGGAET